MGKKAAIYCRLSEEDRNKRLETDDSSSIANQKALLIQYALREGWEVYNLYSDDDYTGSDRNRPAFRQMLRDAEQHRFDIILCKSQSRFTREMELVEKYIHGLFPLWNIRFVSVADHADTENAGNKKSRQINGLVNEWYLEDMSNNIRSVLVNRRQNGYHIGAFALYGYQKDPDQKGHLLIDGEAAAVVREVFTLFSQGYGKTAIARMLNDRGVPNPTEYKRLHGLRCRQPRGKNSTLWRYSAIADMLTNEMYIGNMVQGRYGSVSYKTKQNRPRPKSEWYRVEGTHEPIIDRALWDRVQSRIAQRAKPFSGGEIGLFSRKVLCANCGYTMRSSKNHGRHYLQCSSRHAARDACVGSFISVSLLEQIVLQELARLSDQYLDRDALERGIELKSGLEERRRRLMANLAAYRKKSAEYARGLRALYLDRARGAIGEPTFRELAEGLTGDKDRLDGLIRSEEARLAELERQIASGESRGEVVQRYLHPEHLTREMVELLIDHVTVGKRAKGEKSPPVEIYWNF